MLVKKLAATSLSCSADNFEIKHTTKAALTSSLDNKYRLVLFMYMLKNVAHDVTDQTNFNCIKELHVYPYRTGTSAACIS